MSVKISVLGDYMPVETTSRLRQRYQAWCDRCPWTGALNVVKVAANDEAKMHRHWHRVHGADAQPAAGR